MPPAVALRAWDEGGRPDQALPLTDLSALLAEADAANSSILAAAARRQAATHAPQQAEAFPDPLVSVAYTNDTLTSFTLGSSEFSTLAFTWTQDLPYPGKRKLAGSVARADVDVASMALASERLAVGAAVKSWYAELVRVDRTAAILAESRKLLESFLDAARARYESGDGILENVFKAQTELTKLDAQFAGLAEDRRRVETSLDALLGRTSDLGFGPALAEPRVEDPGREALERAARERAPGLLELRAATRTEQARLDLARRNLKPDFMWGASYLGRGGLEPMVMGMFGVRLPLYRKQKQAQAVAQSESDLEAARRDAEGRQIEFLSQIRELYARASRAATLERLFDEGIIPQAQNALDSAIGSYQVGRAEFTTLFDDFLTVLKYQIDREAQRADRIKAFAALETLTGETLVMPAMPEAGASHGDAGRAPSAGLSPLAAGPAGSCVGGVQ